MRADPDHCDASWRFTGRQASLSATGRVPSSFFSFSPALQVRAVRCSGTGAGRAATVHHRKMQVTDSVQPGLFLGSGKRWATAPGAHAAMTVEDLAPGPITAVCCVGNGVVVLFRQ